MILVFNSCHSTPRNFSGPPLFLHSKIQCPCNGLQGSTSFAPPTPTPLPPYRIWSYCLLFIQCTALSQTCLLADPRTLSNYFCRSLLISCSLCLEGFCPRVEWLIPSFSSDLALNITFSVRSCIVSLPKLNIRYTHTCISYFYFCFTFLLSSNNYHTICLHLSYLLSPYPTRL